MRTIVVCGLMTALAATGLADVANAQSMGGGGMGGGGMGGGHGGGRGGHRGQKGAGQGTPGIAPTAGNRPAPAEVPAIMRLNGVVTVAGETRTLSKTTVAAAKTDQSVVFAERNAQLTLDGMQLSSSSDLSQVDDGREVGLASALLVASQSTVTVTGGSIATTGNGVSALFVGDPGSRAALKGASLSTRAANAGGIILNPGATLQADGVTVVTQSDHAPALAVAGHATLTGGHYTTSGPLSPVFAVSGDLTASGITADAGHSDAITVDGARHLDFTNSQLQSDNAGIRLFASESGPAAGGSRPDHGGRDNGQDHGDMGGPGRASPGAGSPGHGGMVAVTANAYLSDAEAHAPASVKLTGGTLAAQGETFSVSNLTADIALDHVALSSGSGILVKAAAGTSGQLGRNGGTAHIVAHNQILTGDVVTDVISSVRLTLNDHSQLTGKTTTDTDVALDATSTWTLAGDSKVGKLNDPDGITGNTVANIVGNGHILTYDQRYNPALGGKTYALANGGSLIPGNGL